MDTIMSMYEFGQSMYDETTDTLRVSDATMDALEWGCVRLPAPARVPALPTEHELDAHYDLLDALQRVKERTVRERAQERAQVRAKGTDVGRKRR